MEKIQNSTDKKGLSTFILKILATIFMTIDHIGYMIMNYYGEGAINNVGYVFRMFGRLALPIFIFVLIEGLTHTKNIKKYLLRLVIEAIVIYIAMTAIQIIGDGSFNFLYNGNIFITLFILALFYYFIFHSKYKFLCCLPILYIIASFGTKIIFVEGFFTIREVKSFIYFNGLFLQYDIIAPFIFMVTLLGYKIYDNRLKKILANDEKQISEFKKSNQYQRSRNSIVCIIIAFLTLVCYVITYLPFYENGLDQLIDGALQSFMFFSAIPIFFYNGRKGYSNKVIKYAFYLYYPLHIALIYLIFVLITK